jgi:hypothetical protein
MKIKSMIAGLTCLTMILAYSCKKDKDSIPKITISPSPLYIYGTVGDLVTFNINVVSEVALSKFYISQQPDNQIAVTVLDTSITSKGTSFNYYYRMPASLAGKSVVFEFRAEDENGNTSKELKRVYISPPAAVPLTESTGHRMYSLLSTNPDAYNLESNVSQFSVDAAALRDIQDSSNVADTTLGGIWISPAGGLFVKNNGFDYANATDVTTLNAFNGGVQLAFVANVAVGDIFITKLGSLTTNKYVIMRVTELKDNPGRTNDYYEFSIKK